MTSSIVKGKILISFALGFGGIYRKKYMVVKLYYESIDLQAVIYTE